MNKLDGVRVAILATNGFEQSELEKPKKALEDAGADVDVVSLEAGRIKGWKDQDWGDAVAVDKTVQEAEADEYDALVLPGGVMNPDKLRMDADAVAFVRAFTDADKPIAAICHGPWTLVETGALRGRRMTSYAAIRSDLVNAGAQWTDAEVVVDRGLVTSRKPDDLPAFNARMVEVFAEGRRSKRTNGDASRVHR